MKAKTLSNLLLLVLLFSFFTVCGEDLLLQKSRLSEPSEKILASDGFRQQSFSKEALHLMLETKEPVYAAGVWLLETNYGKRSVTWPEGKKERLAVYKDRLDFWSGQKNWNGYLSGLYGIWGDVRCFPVLQPKNEKTADLTFTDSWMHKRTFGGERGHEGTDLMVKEDVPGKYPVVSMTDGIVTQTGWLEKGGYRIGITAPHGGYFYYAHLDSYGSLRKGDAVRAGDILGFAGNTGYGPEGTKGKFATHLHVGIYIFPGGEETSVNPYWILKYVEQEKMVSANAVKKRKKG